MARKTETVTITFDGRDKGKVFVLTELPASEGEDWAMRAIFALMNAGVDIPEGLAQAGLSGLAALGFDALKRLPYEAAKPLFDGMLKCIHVQPSPGVVRPLIEDDIEEVATRLYLRKRILALHMDFFTAAAQSTSVQGAAMPTGA
jgi:hypothetical protein